MRVVTILTLVCAVSCVFMVGCDKPPPPTPTTMGAYQEPPGGEDNNAAPPGPGTVTEPPVVPGPGPTPIPSGGRTYTVKAHEGLMSIARTQLGNAHRWKEIAALNPDIQAPDYRLKVGQVIKLPAK